MAYNVLVAYMDASVQPKATGLGVAIKDERGKLIAWRNKGAPAMTCNQAEYAALIFALERALCINRCRARCACFRTAGWWRSR